MPTFKGRVQIGTKKYDVEIRGGVPYIGGKTVEEFIKTLDPKDVVRMAKVGVMAIQDEMAEILPEKGKYQYHSLA